MDSNPVMEFLLGCNDSQNKELVENNPKRTWLEKAMLNEGWNRWKKKHSKGVVGLASGSLAATLFVAAILIVRTRPDSQSHSLPAVLGQEFLLIALVFITTLLNYGILHDKEIIAEKIARCLANMLRWVSLGLPIILIVTFLVMLVAFVAALYWSQGVTSGLLKYIGSLIVVWIVIFVYLGLGSFLYFPRTRQRCGIRRPRVMRRRLLLAVVENFMWNFTVVALVFCGVFVVKGLSRDSGSSGSTADDVVVDISETLIGVVVSGVLTAIVSGWRIHGQVMGDAARAIERVLVLIRKVEAGESWRTLGVGDHAAIGLVLDLEKALGSNLCSGWYPLHVSIESLNYRTILCREILLILGVRYRDVVPQFESKNWLLERYDVDLEESIVDTIDLRKELELLSGQLQKRTWKRFVNN
ncbi:MAG: hypothetical protein E7Z97_10345 [Propionibacteriaceae bacterium]|nr:hypothetical protein [Propionibacteriaceae bacterium]